MATCGKRHIRLWHKMKIAMAKRFLSEHHHEDLFLKLYSLHDDLSTKALL